MSATNTSGRLTPEDLGAMMRLAVQQAADTVYFLDANGRILYANEAASRTLGYTAVELASMTGFDLDPALTPEVWRERWAMLEHGGAWTVERRQRAKDGRLIPVAVSANLMHQGDLTMACVFVHDITERRRAQEERREVAQLASVLFDSAPVAIVALDMDGRVNMWNAAAERMFGWTSAETIGSRLPIVPEDKLGEFAQIRAATEKGDVVAGLDRPCVRKDGSHIQVRLSTVPLTGPDGTLTGVIGLLEDTTEQKRLEEQLLQAQRLESIGRLAGAVAHDFNNLLTVINGYSELALGLLDPRDPLRDSIQEIKSAGDRAAGLTQQLLAFSRRQVLQPKVLDINAVVGDLELMLRRLIGEDIELVLARDTALGHVQADPVQVQQVLMNLAVNARDAMPSGGKLIIETANVELSEEMTRRHPDSQPGPYVLLGVTDTGSGMDEATRAQIFEPFFTTKVPGKGTGLGLSTVYGVVKQSGGIIWVYSEPGHGSSFKIYLPRVDAVETPVVEESPRTTTVEGSETVLLVEDQPEVRQLALQVLTMYGYRVLSAGDGNQAIEVARQEPGAIDLVLTDVVMPGMGGLELARTVAPMRPGVKIIFMSGYADHAAMQQEQMPADAEYLQKPFTPDGLARKVRQVLDARTPAGCILVVDDEVEIRRLLRQFLEAAGYRVAEAANGRQATAEVDGGGVSLVITDLVMPEQEGIETIREMRKRHPGVKIVAMSGAFGGRFLRTAEMLGAHATLLKPVRAEALVRTVREVLDR